MKIGILTYHRSHNYGALLQAIALRKVLADMGNEVSFIDYWPEYHKHMYDFFSWRALCEGVTFKEKMKYIKNIVLFPVSRNERINNFDVFIKENIMPYTSSLTESYDIVIHGSDQIWRKQPEWNTYNPIYFGKHKIKTKFKISYAASMGILPESDGDKQILKGYFGNLNEISAREDDLKRLVCELGYQCRQDIDPTLLLAGTNWCNLLKIGSQSTGRYVLYYKLLPDSFSLKMITDFAKQRGLELKILNSSASRFKSKKNITTASPKQFLELVYNADYVFTSSFHGLVFSILFHKEFFASFSKNSGRAASILSSLDMSQRLLLPNSDIPADIKKIDYDIVEEKLQDYRCDSLNYLQKLSVHNM